MRLRNLTGFAGATPLSDRKGGCSCDRRLVSAFPIGHRCTPAVPQVDWEWRRERTYMLRPLAFVLHFFDVTGEQEEAYKKSLLISRKDKKDMGFEVKLKKEVVLDS